MSPLKAPYGTWSSPITAEAITKGANKIVDVLVDRLTSEVYHIESRPSEQGRCVLVHTSSNRDVVGSNWNVRTTVQEYGGASAMIYNGVGYFSHMADGRVYRLVLKAEAGGEPEAITPDGKPYRYACFELHPNYPDLLFSVLEDHTIDNPADVVTTLVIINTKTKAIHNLLSGSDFYALPKLSPNGEKLAWVQWSHPDMPWEGGEVHIGDIIYGEEGEVSITNDTHVGGAREKVGAGYPSWVDNETLIFTSDESGFVNPWKYSQGRASPLFPKPVSEDFGQSFWQLHYFPYAIIDEVKKIALFTALKDGRDVLYLVDLNGGAQPKPVNSPFVVIDNIRTVSLDRGEIVFSGQKTNEKEEIIKCSLASLANLQFTVLKAAAPVKVGEVHLPADIISEPQPITLEIQPIGTPLHTVYYPPFSPKYTGSSIAGEKPPCIVNVHGGPTGLASQGLTWGKQYFTSRGWAWLDVNYGGSSGFGRKYIERLANQWGIVDVNDCIFASQALSSHPYNLVDRNRLIIRGGSAGGFTTLAALSIAEDVNVFAAATSLYGVSDLNKLAEFTHKFESRYLDHLMGGTPQEVPEVYYARSPINHARNIAVPLLILQGEIDMVVPKGQAEAIYKTIRDRGGVVEYKLYPGEGHGWRQEAKMRDAYERELGFYERILGLKH